MNQEEFEAMFAKKMAERLNKTIDRWSFHEASSHAIELLKEALFSNNKEIVVDACIILSEISTFGRIWEAKRKEESERRDRRIY
jgi:hypothetical protein